MINAIVFSKDRPMQLDALLGSLEVNAPGVFDVTVLWTTAFLGEMDATYALCEEHHDEVVWMPEGDFRDDVLALVRDASESVCFFTDDDILYRPLVAPMIPSRLLAFSLRLGANTTRCYPHDAEQPLPIVLNDDEDWREWEWKQSDGDFGYPLSLDGHIMNTDMVRPILEESQFGNPNQMEDKLAWTANGTSRLDARPRMGSFPESVLVNVPANRVTETHDTNRVMDAPAYTPLALNDFFLDGWRIAWDEMDYSGVNAAHTELTYVLKKDLDRKRIDQQRYVEL